MLVHPPAARSNASSSSSSSSAAPVVSRLATRGTVQSAVCMPRAAPTMQSFGVRGSALQPPPSSLDANLHVLYATGRGDDSELTLRSILSDEQIERRKQRQRDAAEDNEDDAAALSAFDASNDPAPIVASHRLLGCSGVTRLACLSDRVAVASTGAGECTMMEIANGPEAAPASSSTAAQRRARAAVAASTSLHLRVAHTFPNLHASSATSLAVQLSSSTPMIATCGEDGSLALLAPFTRQIVRHIPCAHPSSLYTLCFGSVHTLHAAGMGGHITSWDLRESTSAASSSAPAKPSAVMVDPNAVSITSSCMHPTRPNLLAVGSSNGSLSLFDLRSTAVPICSIQSQRSAVYDLAFVPWSPSSLLTASEDGSICAFEFGAAGFDGATGTAAAPFAASAAADTMFSSKAVEAGMKPSKIAQQACAIRSISMDRDTRTLIAGTDAPYLLTCTLPAGRL